MNQYEAHNAALRIDGYYTPPREPAKVDEAFLAAKSHCQHHMQAAVGHVAQMTAEQFLHARRTMTAAEITAAHEPALRATDADALLAEVARRGLLADLNGAIGALYDHLAHTGALDGDSKLTAYLSFRLRREGAELTDVGAHRGDCRYWQQKIDGLESDDAAERAAPGASGASGPRVLVVVTGGVAETVQDTGADVQVFDWDNWADQPNDGARVPQRFADLAQPLGVPVQGEESDEAFVRPREAA